MVNLLITIAFLIQLTVAFIMVCVTTTIVLFNGRTSSKVNKWIKLSCIMLSVSIAILLGAVFYT